MHTHTRTWRQSYGLTQTQFSTMVTVLHRCQFHQRFFASSIQQRCIDNECCIWKMRYIACSIGCYPAAVPRVGGILFIVKFKWITGNITLPHLAGTRPPGARLPHCKSVTEKVRALQINQSQQRAAHLVWVTNPPPRVVQLVKEISYRVGLAERKHAFYGAMWRGC